MAYQQGGNYMGKTYRDINLYIKLLNHLGINQIRERENGNWITTSCPFARWTHDKGKDEHPSFGINLSNGVFNCFACGIKGHVSRIYHIWKNVTGIDDPSLKEYADPDNFIPRLFKNIAPRSPRYVSSIPFPFYTGNMFSKLTVKTFSLRYDPRERRIVIPIRYYNNRVVALKGRYVGKDPNALRYRFYKECGGTMPHGLGIWFGYHLPIDSTSPLILVEGERNLLKLWDEGFTNVWASGGAEISNAQLRTLRTCEAKKMILFMDNDKGGETATKRIVNRLRGFITFYKVRNYYGLNDPAEIIEQGILKKALRSAKKI